MPNKYNEDDVKGVRGLTAGIMERDIRMALDCPNQDDLKDLTILENGTLEECYPILTGSYKNSIVHKKAFVRVNELLEKKFEEAKTLYDYVELSHFAQEGMEVTWKIINKIAWTIANELSSANDVTACLSIYLDAHNYCPKSGVKEDAMKKAFSLDLDCMPSECSCLHLPHKAG